MSVGRYQRIRIPVHQRHMISVYKHGSWCEVCQDYFAQARTPARQHIIRQVEQDRSVHQISVPAQRNTSVETLQHASLSACQGLSVPGLHRSAATDIR
eukprot:1829936-Rhodomonas_salina.1